MKILSILYLCLYVCDQPGHGCVTLCVSQTKHSTLINKTNSNYNISVVFLYQKHEKVYVTSCEVVNECAVTESQDYFGGKAFQKSLMFA